MLLGSRRHFLWQELNPLPRTSPPVVVRSQGPCSPNTSYVHLSLSVGFFSLLSTVAHVFLPGCVLLRSSLSSSLPDRSLISRNAYFYPVPPFPISLSLLSSLNMALSPRALVNWLSESPRSPLSLNLIMYFGKCWCFSKFPPRGPFLVLYAFFLNTPVC